MDAVDDAQLQLLVATEFGALADLLDAATDGQWDTASLCAGWRVREVVAHLTMAARYDHDEFMAELGDHAFDFTRLSNAIAARDGSLPTTALVADLRSDVMAHWTPPGGGARGALSHVVIHGLDITTPLEVRRLSPDATIGIVLDELTPGDGPNHFGVDCSGRRLIATDVDWCHGEGRELRGTAGDLVAALSARAVPSDRLVGPTLERAVPGS